VTELLTIEEVSEATRLPINTLYHYRATGQGPKSAKLGRRVMYRRVDVETWITQAFDETAK
jgi:predicted DNA-binding transcriptional regulator AlpA